MRNDMKFILYYPKVSSLDWYISAVLYFPGHYIPFQASF